MKGGKGEVKVKSVEEMMDYVEERLKKKKGMKKGEIVERRRNGKGYVYVKGEVEGFRKEKYEKGFWCYLFRDIREEFVVEFGFWVKERGMRNGKKGGVREKVRLVGGVWREGEKKEM